MASISFEFRLQFWSQYYDFKKLPDFQHNKMPAEQVEEKKNIACDIFIKTRRIYRHIHTFMVHISKMHNLLKPSP